MLLSVGGLACWVMAINFGGTLYVSPLTVVVRSVHLWWRSSSLSTHVYKETDGLSSCESCLLTIRCGLRYRILSRPSQLAKMHTSLDHREALCTC
jgi:hypothetical protein